MFEGGEELKAFEAIIACLLLLLSIQLLLLMFFSYSFITPFDHLRKDAEVHTAFISLTQSSHSWREDGIHKTLPCNSEFDDGDWTRLLMLLFSLLGGIVVTNTFEALLCLESVYVV